MMIQRFILTLTLILCFQGKILGQAFNDYDQLPHNYWKAKLKDPMSLLLENVNDGRVKLVESNDYHLLENLLNELDIDKESQVLVFSKTSLQRAAVSSKNPRAIYFNDEIYLGWMPKGRIEIASADPERGFVFYFQRPINDRKSQLFVRDKVCLECHAGSATNFLPGPLGRSVFPNNNGRSLKSVDTYELIGHHVPLSERWGGWYVTGEHQSLKHMGNAVAYRTNNNELKLKKFTEDLGLKRILKESNYPHPGSDVAALLIFDHQVGIHYELVEAAYRARQSLFNNKKSSVQNNESINKSISSIADDLVPHILMRDEIKLGEKILNPNEESDFIRVFSERGIKDSKGRSLRDLKLKDTIFKYSCSYMIYSKSFVSLPDALKSAVFKRIKDILNNRIKTKEYDYISSETKMELLEILNETVPGFVKLS